MQIFSATDTGIVREENQDSFVCCIKDETVFLVVCDGLGGISDAELSCLLQFHLVMLQKNQSHYSFVY